MSGDDLEKRVAALEALVVTQQREIHDQQAFIELLFRYFEADDAGPSTAQMDSMRMH